MVVVLKNKTNQVPKQDKLAWVVGYKALLIEKKDGDRRHGTEEDHLAASACSPSDR